MTSPDRGSPTDVRRVAKYVLLAVVICLVCIAGYIAIDSVFGPPSDRGLAAAVGAGG
jgi:hypothetical protein